MTVIRRNQGLVNDANQAKLTVTRKKYVAEMNAAIGRVRERFITQLPGQDMIYKAKEDEARLYLSLNPTPETLDDFPFIRAETGVLAPTPDLVAQTWIGMSSYWREVAAQLEGLRMTASNALQAAQSADEMEQVMDIFHEQIGAIA